MPAFRTGAVFKSIARRASDSDLHASAGTGSLRQFLHARSISVLEPFGDDISDDPALFELVSAAGPDLVCRQYRPNVEETLLERATVGLGFHEAMQPAGHHHVGEARRRRVSRSGGQIASRDPGQQAGGVAEGYVVAALIEPLQGVARDERHRDSAGPGWPAAAAYDRVHRNADAFLLDHGVRMFADGEGCEHHHGPSRRACNEINWSRRSAAAVIRPDPKGLVRSKAAAWPKFSDRFATAAINAAAWIGRP